MIHYYVRAHGHDSALRARALTGALLDAGFPLRVFADRAAERILSDLISVDFRPAPGTITYPEPPAMWPRVRQELASLRRCQPDLVIVDGDFAAFVAARRSGIPMMTLRAAGAPGYDFNASRARLFRVLQRAVVPARPHRSLVVCVAGPSDDVSAGEIAVRPDPVPRRFLARSGVTSVLLSDSGLESAPIAQKELSRELTRQGHELGIMQSRWRQPHDSLTRSADERALSEMGDDVIAIVGPANASLIDEAARAGVPLCVGYQRQSAEERAHAELITSRRLGIAVPLERLCTNTILRFIELVNADVFSTATVDEELPTLATTLVHEARRFVQPARREANTTQQHAI